MDIQTKKLNIIEEVLRLESGELIEKLARYLKKLKPTPASTDDLPLMPIRGAEEMKARYEQSLRELDNNEGISQEQVEELMRQHFRA